MSALTEGGHDAGLRFPSAKIQPAKFGIHLIAREALERRLLAAIGHVRLLLIAAPAGYGKTAALARAYALFGKERRGMSAWITADEAEDLPRFVASLAAAIDPWDVPFRASPESLAELGNSPCAAREVADALAGAFAAAETGQKLIVVDDAHKVRNPAVFHMLTRLLRQLPPAWTIALGSRSRPPLSLASLMVAGDLAEFGQEDLQFNSDEVGLVLRARGLEDDSRFTRQLLDRTEGWPAALQLVLASADRGIPHTRAWRRSAQQLFDYLTEEVFDDMPEEMQDFLLRCSVLPELTVSSCRAVTGNVQSGQMLDELVRRCLFVVQLGDEEVTLRLHDLFAEFLQDRLARTDPQGFCEGLTKAAMQERDPLRRLRLLLRARAWPAAESLLLEQAWSPLTGLQLAPLQGLIDQFPHEMHEESGALALAKGLLARFQNRWAVMGTNFTQAVRLLKGEDNPLLAHRARALQALGHCYTGQTDQARQYLHEVNPEYLRDPLAVIVYHHVAGFVTTADGPPAAPAQHLAALIGAARAQGHAPAHYVLLLGPANWLSAIGRPGILPLLRELLIPSGDVGQETFFLDSGPTGYGTAWLLIWQGRVEEARHRVMELEQDARWTGPGRHHILLRLRQLVLLSLAVVTGDRGEADRFLSEAETPEWTRHHRGVIALAAVCRMGLGQWDEVVPLVGLMRDESHWPFWGVFQPVLRAALLTRMGRCDEAVSLLEASAKDAARAERLHLFALVRVRWALAELGRGQAQAAWDGLLPLVQRMRQTGERGQALLCGHEALQALKAAPWPASADPADIAEVHRWADMSARWHTPHEGRPSPEGAGPVYSGAVAGTGLSAREWQVLVQIADGRSNKVIARSLTLSPNTVKRHVANILGKLDVASRGEAAAWYVRRVAVVPAEVRRQEA